MKNKKWSILIWVIFLSLFIITFFVSYQSYFFNVSKNFDDYSKYMEDNIKTDNNINSIKNNISILTDSWLIDDNYFKINRSDEKFWEYEDNFRYNEEKEYWITSSWWSKTIGLTVRSWWPILYKLISFYDVASPSINNSWAIETNYSTWINLIFRSNNHKNILSIRNLGINAKISISKWNTTFIPPISKYSIEWNIQNITQNEKGFEIINFAPKSYTWLNYEKLWLYINNSN